MSERDTRRRTIRSVIGGCAVGVLLVIGGVQAASATTVEPPEGGVWEYGVYTPGGDDIVYSNYYHPTNWHRSSVTVSSGQVYRSVDQPKKVWAKISKVTGWSGRMAHYYRYNY